VRTEFLLAITGMLTLGVLACAEPCTADYESCSAQPGLLYVACSDSRHEFSDGTSFTDAEEAFTYCYCPWQGINCDDGRTADFCTEADLFSSNHSDRENTTTFSDGTEESFTEGYEICMNYESCWDSEFGCSDDRWYLECYNDVTDPDYIAWDGSEFGTEDEVKDYCDS